MNGNNVQRILFIGFLEQDRSFLQAMKLLNDIEIKAVVDPSAKKSVLLNDSNSTVFIFPTIDDLLETEDIDPNFDIILDTIDLINDSQTAAIMQRCRLLLKKEHIVFWRPYIEKLLQFSRQLHWKDAVMEAAQEGIQVVDEKGTITYANAAFTRIVKIPLEERIGKNVFEVSADGSLAYVLRTGKPVFGNTHMTNGIPIIANASPLIEDGKIVGAVTVFNDASSIERMAHILQKNKDEIDSLRAEIRKLNQPKYTFADLIGESQVFQNCLHQAKQAADSFSTVLITGESGTGKELFAHSIHEFGLRSKQPFVKVNCPAIPGNLLESELFGYEKGAFTGATKAKMGKFELANGGTIFLDEIGDLDLVLQAKLLRVLQEREVERIGGSHPIQVDVRVIAATNQNFQELIEKGQFRRDLYYRLNVIHIHVPPLRERPEDIPLLAQNMFQKFLAQRSSKNTYGRQGNGGQKNLNNDGSSLLNQLPKIDQQALRELCNYSWPGNVRELENLIEKLIIFSDCSMITREDVIYALYSDEKVQINELACQSLAMMEKRMILAALERYGYSLTGKKTAAAELGISLTCLYDKIKKYHLSSKHGEAE